MDKILTWIRHNQGLFVALVISQILLVWTFGCESKVTSLVEADKKVTRAELALELDKESARLEMELDMLSRQAQLKVAELDRQDEIKRKLLAFAALSVETGAVNPLGLLGLLGYILGVGLVVDNRIKDKVIKNRPLPEAPDIE